MPVLGGRLALAQFAKQSVQKSATPDSGAIAAFGSSRMFKLSSPGVAVGLSTRVRLLAFSNAMLRGLEAFSWATLVCMFFVGARRSTGQVSLPFFSSFARADALNLSDAAAAYGTSYVQSCLLPASLHWPVKCPSKLEECSGIGAH